MADLGEFRPALSPDLWEQILLDLFRCRAHIDRQEVVAALSHLPDCAPVVRMYAPLLSGVTYPEFLFEDCRHDTEPYMLSRMQTCLRPYAWTETADGGVEPDTSGKVILTMKFLGRPALYACALDDLSDSYETDEGLIVASTVVQPVWIEDGRFRLTIIMTHLHDADARAMANGFLQALLTTLNGTKVLPYGMHISWEDSGDIHLHYLSVEGNSAHWRQIVGSPHDDWPGGGCKVITSYQLDIDLVERLPSVQEWRPAARRRT